MSTFSHIEVCGHIGDAELRRARPPSNRPYLRLNVAVDDEEDGQKKTAWFVCIINNKAVETPDKLMKVFRIGRKVFVRGTPKVRAYKKRDGSWVAETTVLVDGLPKVLDSKPKDF